MHAIFLEATLIPETNLASSCTPETFNARRQESYKKYIGLTAFLPTTLSAANAGAMQSSAANSSASEEREAMAALIAEAQGAKR